MDLRAMAAAAMSGGIEGQLVALLNAAGVKVESKDVQGDEGKRAAFAALGRAAALPSASVLRLEGSARGKRLVCLAVITD